MHSSRRLNTYSKVTHIRTIKTLCLLDLRKSKYVCTKRILHSRQSSFLFTNVTCSGTGHCSVNDLLCTSLYRSLVASYVLQLRTFNPLSQINTSVTMPENPDASESWLQQSNMLCTLLPTAAYDHDSARRLLSCSFWYKGYTYQRSWNLIPALHSLAKYSESESDLQAYLLKSFDYENMRATLDIAMSLSLGYFTQVLEYKPTIFSHLYTILQRICRCYASGRSLPQLNTK